MDAGARCGRRRGVRYDRGKDVLVRGAPEEVSERNLGESVEHRGTGAAVAAGADLAEPPVVAVAAGADVAEPPAADADDAVSVDVADVDEDEAAAADEDALNEFFSSEIEDGQLFEELDIADDFMDQEFL